MNNEFREELIKPAFLFYTLPQDVAAERLAPLLRISEVTCSNLGPETGRND
jgi:hypothetical protein